MAKIPELDSTERDQLHKHQDCARWAQKLTTQCSCLSTLLISKHTDQVCKNIQQDPWLRVHHALQICDPLEGIGPPLHKKDLILIAAK